MKKQKKDLEKAKEIWQRLESFEKILKSVKKDFFLEREVSRRMKIFLESIPC